MHKLLVAIIVCLGIHLCAFIPETTQVWTVNTTQSILTWEGKKTGGGHTGNIQLKSGQLIMLDDKIISGNFKIDINSITCADLQHAETNEKLITHLKSDDFFGVKQYPTAHFELLDISYGQSPAIPENMHTVKGSLTIKGITNNIEFPAMITFDADTMLAQGRIKIDRTQWEIRYGSGKFFDNLGDNIISDFFTLEFQIEAIKQ